jgi:predicted lipoprotein with Yx(FWY)xxD motif
MRRTRSLLAATGITALAVAAAAASAAPATIGTPTINVSSRTIGKILTTNGFTLYMFTHDTANHDTCVAISGCTSVWPPLLTSGKPHAGPGVNAALNGTIKLPSGHLQATYNKHPLYRYKFDTAGSTGYVDVSQFGGMWDALTPAGNPVN